MINMQKKKINHNKLLKYVKYILITRKLLINNHFIVFQHVFHTHKYNRFIRKDI